MLFLMFNEKYLSAAIMKSCFPDPVFPPSGQVCCVTFKSSFASPSVRTLFYPITKDQSHIMLFFLALSVKAHLKRKSKSIETCESKMEKWHFCLQPTWLMRNSNCSKVCLISAASSYDRDPVGNCAFSWMNYFLDYLKKTNFLKPQATGLQEEAKLVSREQ